MLRRLSMLLSLVGALGISLPLALADQMGEPIVLLGVSRAGRHDAAQTKALLEHLEHAGEAGAKAPALAGTERACQDPVCFEVVARREGAQAVLTALVQENSPTNFYITMVLFDARRRVPEEETAPCEPCTGEQLSTKLGSMSDALLRKYRDARGQQTAIAVQPPNVPGVGPVQTSGAPSSIGYVPKVRLGWPERLSFGRKLAAGLLGGVAAGALIFAISFNAVDRKLQLPSDSCPSGDCVAYTVPAYTTGYVIAGAAAIGMVFTLAWPVDSQPAEKK